MAIAQQRDATWNQVKQKLGFVGASGLPQSLTNVRTAAEGSNPRPIDSFDGYLYGVTQPGGSIYRIALDAISDSTLPVLANWTLMNAAAAPTSLRILPMSDGEVLLCIGGAIWKSSGWAANPTTATWTVKVTATAGGNASFLQFGIDYSPDRTKVIAVEYSGGVPDSDAWSQSRKVLVSLDSGNTWTLVYDTEVVWGSAKNRKSHLHAACYDPWANDGEGGFWFTEGHGDSFADGPVGLYFTDPDGLNATRCTGDYPKGATPTVMVATEYGLVMGTDSVETGLWLFPRTKNPLTENAVQMCEFRHGVAVHANTHFADRGFRDPDTGIVYVSFETGLTGAPTFIAASDGRSASIVYEGTATSGDKILQVMAARGKLIAHYTDTAGTSHKHLFANFSNDLRVPNRTAEDRGYITGGFSDDMTSVCVGRGSSIQGDVVGDTIGRSAVVGVANIVSGVGVDSVCVLGFNNSCTKPLMILIGDSHTIDTGTNNIVIGWGHTESGRSVDGTFQVCIGTNNNLGTDGVLSIGSGNTSLGNSSLSIGNGIDSGIHTNAVGIGVNIDLVSDCTAIGNAITMTGVSSVAIGNNSTTELNGTAVGFTCSSGQYSAAFGTSSIAGLVGGSFVCAAFGYDVDVTATGGYGLGASIDVTHANSGVLGYNMASTAANQLKIGPVHIELTEQTEPAAPAANDLRLYAVDDGAGTTCLRVRTAIGIYTLAPHELRSFTVATVPSAAFDGRLIYVTDEAGGEVPAFSDGTNWRRFTDRAIIS